MPVIDPQDYATNMERSSPSELPETVYVVYYKADNGEWIWTLPHFYLENAVKFASILTRDYQILTYSLTNFEFHEYKAPPKRRIRQVMSNG